MLLSIFLMLSVTKKSQSAMA